MTKSKWKPCPVCGAKVKYVRLKNDEVNNALTCTACPWFILLIKEEEG